MTSPAKFKKDKEIIAEYDTQVKDKLGCPVAPVAFSFQKRELFLGLTLLPRLECSGLITAHCSFDLLGSNGTTGMRYHTWLIFKRGFTILNRLVSNSGPCDLPALASQSAEIASVSHRTQPRGKSIAKQGEEKLEF
ncbi:Protein PPP5D1 [Plecturocebus cupreus]